MTEKLFAFLPCTIKCLRYLINYQNEPFVFLFFTQQNTDYLFKQRNGWISWQINFSKRLLAKVTNIDELIFE